MPKRLKDFARHQEFWLAIVFVVLFVGLSIASPNFLSLQNGVDLISSYHSESSMLTYQRSDAAPL